MGRTTRNSNTSRLSAKLILFYFCLITQAYRIKKVSWVNRYNFFQNIADVYWSTFIRFFFLGFSAIFKDLLKSCGWWNKINSERLNIPIDNLVAYPDYFVCLFCEINKRIRFCFYNFYKIIVKGSSTHGVIASASPCSNLFPMKE